jgi:hypothetical protein
VAIAGGVVPDAQFRAYAPPALYLNNGSPVPLAPDLLDLRGAATAIGVSYDWITRADNCTKLYKRGFPRPLNRPGRKVWLKANVEQWRDQPPTAPQRIDQGGRPPTSNVVSIQQGKSRLRAALARG